MNSIQSRSGAEGPRHDPYHYEEITVRNRMGSFTLHEGLGRWVEVRLKAQNFTPVRFDQSKFSDAEIDAVFATGALMPPASARRALRHKMELPLRAHNARCTGRRFECVSGMPGESLTVCRECGDVVDCDFDEGAVR